MRRAVGARFLSQVDTTQQAAFLVEGSDRYEETLQPWSMEDLSWAKGRHNMRYGGQFTYIQLNEAYGAYAQAVEQLGATLPAGTKR